MKIVVYLFADFLLIIGVISMNLDCGGIYAYSLEKSKKIDRLFGEVITSIQAFELANDRYPTYDEYEKSIGEYRLDCIYCVQHIGYSLNGEIPSDIAEKYVKPVTTEYYTLRFWRGEWAEYYMSWIGESTAPKTMDDYKRPKENNMPNPFMIVFILYFFARNILGARSLKPRFRTSNLFRRF